MKHDPTAHLADDLERMRAAIHRRHLLRLTAGLGVIALGGCTGDGAGSTGDGPSTGDDPTTGGGGDASTTGTSGTESASTTGTGGTDATPTTGDATVCEPTPEETAGPFPGDGSNGANALALAGIVRSDIRTSVGGATGTADGVPLTIVLRVVDRDCAPLAGVAVYLWHCDRNGDYSMYAEAIADENYLRGVQATDADGELTFRSIFPACYPGRWPHAHFEVYPSLASATTAASELATSQLALPAQVCDEVYASPGYEGSAASFAALDLAADGVFKDGVALQMTTVTGDLAAGLVAALTITITT